MFCSLGGSCPPGLGFDEPFGLLLQAHAERLALRHPSSSLQSLQRSSPLGAHLQGDKAGQGAGPDAEVSRCSHLDDRGSDTEDGEEVMEVVTIRGQHCDIASACRTGRSEGERRVDDIRRRGLTAEQPGGAGQETVERHFVTVSQRPNEQHLTASVSPRLGDDPRGDVHRVTGVGRDAQHRPDGAVVAIECDQCAGIKDERAHPSSRLRAAARSSSVKAPCSASQSAITSRRPREESWWRAASANQAETFWSSASAVSRTAAAARRPTTRSDVQRP